MNKYIAIAALLIGSAVASQAADYDPTATATTLQTSFNAILTIVVAMGLGLAGWQIVKRLIKKF